MGLSEELKLAIDKYVSDNKVVLFMKGNRQFPQCGFSNTCVQARLPLYRRLSCSSPARVSQLAPCAVSPVALNVRTAYSSHGVKVQGGQCKTGKRGVAWTTKQ